MLEIQCGVVVGLGNVGEQRGKADPRVVVIDAGTTQGYRNLVGVGQRGRREILETRVLHDVGKVAGKAELVGQFIGGSGTECIVEPVVIELGRRNHRAVGSRGTDVVVGKPPHIFAGSVLHGSVLAIEGLPFEACAIIEVKLRRDVPVVGGIKGQLVLVAFVVFRGILVVVVEVVVALVGIVEPQGITAVGGHALVVHGGVGGVVDVVVPLVQAQTQGRCFEFLRQFRSKEHLVDVARVEAGHARLHIVARVGRLGAVDVLLYIVVGRVALDVDERHGCLVDKRAAGVVVACDDFPVEAVSEVIVVHQRDFARPVVLIVIERG